MEEKMKTLEKIFNFLFKLYFAITLISAALLTGSFGFLMYSIYKFEALAEPQVSSAFFAKLKEELFPTSSAQTNYTVTVLLGFMSLSLACLLFRCLSKFFHAKITEKSLEMQISILARAPKLLVGLYALAVTKTFFPFHEPDNLKSYDSYGSAMMGFHVGTRAHEQIGDILTPNLNSSLNIILALIIYAYVKNLRETDVLRREADLVV